MTYAKHKAALKPRDMAFLATALLLHAALLLLPLKPWKNPSVVTPPRLTIDLRQPPQPLPPKAEPDAARSEEIPIEKTVVEKPDPEPLEPLRRKPRIALEELPAKPADIPPTEAPELLTARQLKELVKRTPLQNGAAAADRQLGTARPYEPPANWDKNAGAPYLADFDNRFNGMTVPAEVEIVDRWLASDGSHNVVVNLPNGDTMCGRAEAYNPMQPLVEHIMMFRPCGGGGNRTFAMPERYKKGQ